MADGLRWKSRDEDPAVAHSGVQDQTRGDTALGYQ